MSTLEAINMSLKIKFIEHLSNKYPRLNLTELEALVSDNLLSPGLVQLPIKLKTQLEVFTQAIFKIRTSQNYLSQFRSFNAGNSSILMSYDFHIDKNENLKLIEVNTNASFFSLGLELYEVRSVPTPFSGSSYDALKHHIYNELELFGKKLEKPKIGIIDENPQSQKLFSEFLVFNEVFKNFGWDCQIIDFKNVDDSFNFIYNRYTDFLFTNPTSQKLKNFFESKAICFSPNPFEYETMADKNCMKLWKDKSIQLAARLTDLEIQIINEVVPNSVSVTQENSELIWEKRKNLFFKPANSFGSKSSFKGSSVSRKAFESILSNNIIAQDFVDAPRIDLEIEGKKEEFKYDLRFYFYRDQVDFGIARLYQGQVTNLQTPHGGFAPIVFY